MIYSCPPADLQHVLRHAGSSFETLRNARLFITGGTGFWGIWLMESLAYARSELGLSLNATLLTRSPEAFQRNYPALAGEPWLQLLHGDVRTFTFPQGSFTHVVHAATEANERLNREQPDLMLDTISAGTRRVLEFTAQSGAGKYLLASSGAIYGSLPSGMGKVPETYVFQNTGEPVSAYAKGKRLAESDSLRIAKLVGFDCLIARGFAFIGPHLPLNTHFAIGNFLRDVLKGGPILIKGDGTPRRSYLHASDMTSWLWTILAMGKSGSAYNVGSHIDYSIRQTAEIVAGCAGHPDGVQVALPPKSDVAPNVYVPDIQKASKELGLNVRISLEHAVERTLVWLRKRTLTAS